MERQHIDRKFLRDYCRVVNFAQRRCVVDLELLSKEQIPTGPVRYSFISLLHHLEHNDTLMLDNDVWYAVNIATEFGHTT